jgi:hypothetical protein
MEWIEEHRALSHMENIFRNLFKRKVSHLIHLVAIAARQIGKVTWCVMGDEDSSFYHSRASARLRANHIKIVESEETHFFTHREKERDLSSLSSPFLEQEIHNALKQIPRDKSPGPDGFGSVFIKIFGA